MFATKPNYQNYWNNGQYPSDGGPMSNSNDSFHNNNNTITASFPTYGGGNPNYFFPPQRFQQPRTTGAQIVPTASEDIHGIIDTIIDEKEKLHRQTPQTPQQSVENTKPAMSYHEPPPTPDYNHQQQQQYNMVYQNHRNKEEYAQDRLEMIKKSMYLSKIYRPDKTPLKSLWDSSDMVDVKETRLYKYEPKPLERRKNPRNFVAAEKKTKEYWERRRKNNLAARKSREDRRKKEMEVLKSVEDLNSENRKLKVYAQTLMSENQNLKYEYTMIKPA